MSAALAATSTTNAAVLAVAAWAGWPSSQAYRPTTAAVTTLPCSTLSRMWRADSRGSSAARRLLHEVGRAFFGLEHDGAGRVDDQFQKRDVQRRQHQRQPEQHRQQRQPDDGHVHRQRVDHGLRRLAKVCRPR